MTPSVSVWIGPGPENDMAFFVGSIIVFVFCLIAFGLWFFPVYNVWVAKKSGDAALAEAMREQRVQLAVASARKEAAHLNKDAAIIEAEAVAEQIARIGKELQSHDLYLRWQWIRMMQDREGETIYVPTEANLPILEATRRAQ